MKELLRRYKIFVKPRNEIYARHLLATARQNIGESIDEFVLRIDKLSQNCSFIAVTTLKYKDAMKTDSFISGILSNIIRQRLLLESRTLTFVEAYEKARALDLAKISSESYSSDQASYSSRVCTVNNSQFNEVTSNQSDTNDQNVNAIRNQSSKQSQKFVCYFCGGFMWHPRNRFPAKNEICDCCGKLGHYAKCCLKRKSFKLRVKPLLASVTNLQSNFSEHVLTAIRINNIDAHALVDTGSTNSYICKNFAKQHGLNYKSIKFAANMVNSSLKTEICGVYYLNLTFVGNLYKNFKFHVMPNLICDAIIGNDLLQQHKSVTFKFQGKLPELVVSTIMSVANVPYPQLFGDNLSARCKPIAIKTRKFSSVDTAIIKAETVRLLQEDRIESSNSPWRAQPLVVNNGKKKRMCIDYSQTINLFTNLDAYPLPSISSLVNQVAKWKYISTLDLKSAYHQIQIRPKDRPYTAFQSGSQLYQWKVMPSQLSSE